MTRQCPPLHLPQFSHDACGVGFVTNIDGKQRHSLLQMALEAAANLAHRGALDADGKTGDGAGILTQLPRKLLNRELERLTGQKSYEGVLGVGMVFLARGQEARSQAIINNLIVEAGLDELAWRPVPVNRQALGKKAAATEPNIMQVIVGNRAGFGDQEFERRLYWTRRRIERRLDDAGLGRCHIASFSHRLVVYKALAVAPDLPDYFCDLRDPDFETALALFHQRYSTNTLPDWSLAQPLRMIAHNGEINTISANRNWMRAREPELRSAIWGDQLRDLLPVIASQGSDSASLDNVIEFLVMSGQPVEEALMQLVPEAHESLPEMSAELRGFYDYMQALSEPWDGPAALVFSDGRMVGASLDRNGLRPARYTITRDGLVVLASEAGVLRLDESELVAKGQLGPGEMIVVDTVSRRLLSNLEIKNHVARRFPYRDWLKRRRRLSPRPATLPPANIDSLRRKQRMFGWTEEDERLILTPMAVEMTQPVGSMGNDTPLAVLSLKPRLLYDYFHQIFAQVTNPPIDPLREELVMSLATLLGKRQGFLDRHPQDAEQIMLDSPLLNEAELEWLLAQAPPFAAVALDATFPATSKGQALEYSLTRLLDKAEEEVRKGKTLLVLSDRSAGDQSVPIPALLAVAAAHHHLIRKQLRMRVSLIVDSGEPRSEHQFATLLGYGADAIVPYLAYAAVARMARDGLVPGATAQEAVARYKRTIEKGILKIMSKMGISVVASYRGAQLFEAVGLGQELIDQYFPGTPSRVGGIGLSQIASDALARHGDSQLREGEQPLEEAGTFRFRRSGEHHAFNPPVFRTLHKLAISGTYEDYKKLTSAIAAGAPVNLRDLLRLRPGHRIPLDSVEPVESIMRRFSTASMSLGALSAEAHETLAIAMNRIGAKSGSGEGGENPRRYRLLPNGDSSCSKIKQVASGRFGVTPQYLASAEELEIKMAQGSKPGEGGQLPGHKVTAEVAALRHASPGQPLISPPPHHDIYSIEDLAQLIYDLRQANARAAIAVKLVAAPGVGTVAAGVAKADADIIHISAYDGGTGASPLGSIKHAGLPWELGLAETQQVLIANGLRGGIRLRVDGGMRTARDIIIAAALGADEFGFGSAVLVAAGCVMARQCHLNTCPVGIATQDEKLRARFSGKPQMVINYLRAVAEEVREFLAALGLGTLDELVGRSDLLAANLPDDHPRAATLDLAPLLAPPGGPLPGATVRQSRHYLQQDNGINERLVAEAIAALKHEESVVLHHKITNSNRSIGTRLSAELLERYGDRRIKDAIVTCYLTGSAGQSLGAFLTPGVRLVVTGEANDYVGKGMAGGEIVIRPPSNRGFDPSSASILGNTALYGATGGHLFAAGSAGERFAVRNSGAVAVIEGVGNHCCEYMTRGTVVVLGTTGVNFGAGMTGGTAYVLDTTGSLEKRVNPQFVILNCLQGSDEDLLLKLLHRHAEATGSTRARRILQEWECRRKIFLKVTGAATRKSSIEFPSPTTGPATAREEAPAST